MLLKVYLDRELTVHVCKCKCGHVTITLQKDLGDRKVISMTEGEFDKYFLIDADTVFSVYSCNACVNNWSTAYCACGSGEPWERCSEGLPECNTPYYNLEEFAITLFTRAQYVRNVQRGHQED